MAENNNSSGWAGVVSNLVKTQGAPTVGFLALLVAVCIGLNRFLSPLISSHATFLEASVKAQEKTSDAVEEIKKSTAGINQTLESIDEVEQETKIFMQQVREEHREANGKLDSIQEDTTEIIDKMPPP